MLTRQVSYIYFTKVNLTTDAAFLPGEKIKLKITIGVVQPEYLAAATKQKIRCMVQGASFTSSKRNKPFPQHDFDEFHSRNRTVELLSQFYSDNAMFELYPTNENDIFSGEAEIIFKKPGSYVMTTVFFFDSRESVRNVPTKIEIGSSVELMNKKTNDILLVMTVLTLALWLATELRKKIYK